MKTQLTLTNTTYFSDSTSKLRRSSLPDFKIFDQNVKKFKIVNFEINPAKKRDHSAPLKHFHASFNKSNNQQSRENIVNGSENLKNSAFKVKSAMKSPRKGKFPKKGSLLI